MAGQTPKNGIPENNGLFFNDTSPAATDSILKRAVNIHDNIYERDGVVCTACTDNEILYTTPPIRHYLGYVYRSVYIHPKHQGQA